MRNKDVPLMSWSHYYTFTHGITWYLLNPYVPASVERVIRVSVDGYRDRRCTIEIDVH